MHTTLAVFAGPFLGMGVTELIIILVIALLIFGPKNLPKLGSALGKTVKNVREGLDGNGELPEGDAELEEDEEEDEEEEKPAPKKKASTKKK
ncbi:MAG: twin-arginine translocase TatA/TatE family subunit [Coriobacteriales bacterium]|jgi:sec-independent protein translocase protein TatA|nr:twin-arginine translocase TatA/TatE family subunit [Coriobacteriales bacterium]